MHNHTSNTDNYALSLHDALPISSRSPLGAWKPRSQQGNRSLGRLGIHSGYIVARRALWRSDRKSTRLNSSHANTSYAVFCLKNKKGVDLGRIDTHHHQRANGTKP